MSQNMVVINHLDPTAQEFYPTYHHHQLPFLPFPPPPPPPQQQPVYLPKSIPKQAVTPTRAILLTAVPPEISETQIRNNLELFGDVRAVEMDRVYEGIIVVHFYDLRSAHAAVQAIREQHMQHQQRLQIHFLHFGSLQPPLPPPVPGVISGRVVWAHFTLPSTTNAFPDSHNQGTIVVFNLDPNIDAVTLTNLFNVFGPVKELRETPMKKQQRFIEFYDVRNAARALSEMNGKEINGKTVMIEYSRPGGHFNKFHHNYNRNSNSNFNYNYSYNAGFGVDNVVKPPPRSPLPPSPTPPSHQHHRVFPFRNRKTSPLYLNRRRRSSPVSDEGCVESAMSKLTLQNKGSGSASDKPKKVCRPWKGKQKNYDPRYLIKEEAIIMEGDSSLKKDMRTTVMIKNIPNKYSQKLLLNMLDNHCIHCNEQISSSSSGDNQLQPLSSYDFVYLPIDFNNKCNVGYGFVNMTSPEATLRLYKAFHHQHWEVFNSRKICEVTYARVQGLEALKEHFKNSKFACENDEYLPVVFTPSRDGRCATSPLPIVFNNILNTATTSPSSNASTITAINDDDDDQSRSSSSDDGGDVIN